MEGEGNLEQYTSDEIIRSNLRLFLKYIVQCIPATLLLTHLQIYNKGQRKEIFSMSCSRPHQATEMALQILIDQTERQGLFVSLIQALETLDYPKVVNILSGKYVPNELYDEKIVDLFTPTIIQQLNPVEILPHLMKYGVIGGEEKQIVLAENINHGAMMATYLLLSYLPSRMEDWFRYFLLALIDCHQEDLAKTLEPDLFLKIMTQTTTEKQVAVYQSDKRMPEASSVGEHVLLAKGEADTDLKADLMEDPEDVTINVATDDTSAADVTASTTDNRIRYDSEFLFYLRHSPLADYIPHDVMKHPDIFCRLPQQQVKDESIKYDSEFLLSLRYSPLAEYIPQEVMKDPDIFCRLPQQPLKATDKRIRYDSEFLFYLRHSPLADYILHDVMKHPDIFCRLPQQQVKVTGMNMPDYCGARPKVPVSDSSATCIDRKVPVKKRNSCDDNRAYQVSVHVEQPKRDQIKDGSSENKDQIDNIDDLKKDIEEILLGDLNKTQHRQADKSDTFEKENFEENEKSKQKKYQQLDDVKEGQQMPGDNVEDKDSITELKVKLGETPGCIPADKSDIFEKENFEENEKSKQKKCQQLDNVTEGYLMPGDDVEDKSSITELKLKLGETPGCIAGLNALGNVETIYNRSDSVAVNYNIDTATDKRIRYDSEFLLSLRHLPLADYIPHEVMKHPDIFCRLPQQQVKADMSDIFEKENFEVNEKSKQKKCQQLDSVTEGHQMPGESITELKLKLGETPGCIAGLNALGNVETIYNRSDSDAVSYNINTEIASSSNGGARPKVRNLISRKTDCDSQLLAGLLYKNHSEPEEIPSKNTDTVDVRKAHDETSSDFVNLKENSDESKDIYDFDKVLADLLLADLPELYDESNPPGDVEFIYDRTDSIEDNYSIDTDSDLIEGVEDTQTVELREYQKELAREGIEGENVIIMAPTNSGKTRVAVRIVQEHLRRQRREQRIAAVIFLVQDEILAIQQAKTFAEFLPAYRTKIISGKTQRDKKEFLKDFIMRRDILVVTAQVLINALELGEIKDLTRFTMMVFDECHHANKYHPYNQILGKYIDLKIGQKVDARELPQVVGMTASLGCGGSLAEKTAMKHLKKVMANMDARCLCTVRENLEELRVYVNPPVEEIRQVDGRVDNGFEVAVNELFDRIDHYMITNTEQAPGIKHIVPGGRGTEEFHQWLAGFKKTVAATGSENARVMNPCRHHLLVYNNALMIYKDVRVKEAMKIIDRCMNRYIKLFKLQPDKDDTYNFLIELYEDLKQKSFDTELENPKLIEMQKIILEVLGHDGNARGVIFVKTRQLAQALISWMNDTEELKEFSAAEMVGQTAAAYKGGSTKRQLVDVVDYFKEGRHKILVATSVLEEGIDVSKCNLVIRYEHVTNEIVRLQSRGRARAADSKYFVLTEAGSKIVAREEKNRLLEKLMNRLVPELQQHIERDMNQWEAEMLQIQEEIQKKLKKESEKTHTSVSIQCLNCQTEICKSHDIKKIKNVHHVIVGLQAAEYFLFDHSAGGFDDDELEYSGTVRCIKCSYDLGCICIYKDTDFPMLKISSWRDANGKSYKKWKKVPFSIESFTLDDLRDVVEQREAMLD